MRECVTFRRETERGPQAERGRGRRQVPAPAHQVREHPGAPRERVVRPRLVSRADSKRARVTDWTTCALRPERGRVRERARAGGRGSRGSGPRCRRSRSPSRCFRSSPTRRPTWSPSCSTCSAAASSSQSSPRETPAIQLIEKKRETSFFFRAADARAHEGMRRDEDEDATK